MDPAKPLVPNGSRGKLDVADAEMVQVLHTSSNYGDAKKTGHVDFYFNGGRIQPFCSHAGGTYACVYSLQTALSVSASIMKMLKIKTYGLQKI